MKTTIRSVTRQITDTYHGQWDKLGNRRLLFVMNEGTGIFPTWKPMRTMRKPSWETATIGPFSPAESSPYFNFSQICAVETAKGIPCYQPLIYRGYQKKTGRSWCYAGVTIRLYRTCQILTSTILNGCHQFSFYGGEVLQAEYLSFFVNRTLRIIAFLYIIAEIEFTCMSMGFHASPLRHFIQSSAI